MNGTLGTLRAELARLRENRVHCAGELQALKDRRARGIAHSQADRHRQAWLASYVVCLDRAIARRTAEMARRGVSYPFPQRYGFNLTVALHPRASGNGEAGAAPAPEAPAGAAAPGESPMGVLQVTPGEDGKFSIQDIRAPAAPQEETAPEPIDWPGDINFRDPSGLVGIFGAGARLPKGSAFFYRGFKPRGRQ